MKSPLVRLVLVALSGTLLFLSCADFDIWPLAWIGLVPTILAALDENTKRPFLYGWVCGLFANGGGFYWINGLLQRFGHMPFVASFPIFFLMIAYQALEFGAFAWVLRRLRDHTKLPVVLLAPVVMTALELVTPFVFPWYLAITQAWVRPVIQIADLTGPLGVSFLLVLSNGALYQALMAALRREKQAWPQLGAAAGVVALALVYGQVRIHQVEAARAKAEKVRIGVVQANIGIQEKWDPALSERNLAAHQRLSADLEKQGADLIVWPESSYPYAIARNQTEDFSVESPARVHRGFDTPILFGALTIDRIDRVNHPYPFNTALMMDREGRITGSFDKNFLLVFGEYIPFYERIKWVQKLIPEASNFARGDTVTTFPFSPTGRTGKPDFQLGPMICYEDIVPAFGRRLVARRPNVLINITNDAWFGATSEPWEHMALAVYRAVEHRLDLVRAVNTGVSAYIDSTGRVWQKSPPVDPSLTPDAKPVTMLEPVAMQEPAGVYATVGDLFGALNLVALLVFAAMAAQRAGRPVAWRAVGMGASALVGLSVVAAVLASLPDSSLGLKLLVHTPMTSTDETFSAGLKLLVGTGVASLLVGVLLGRLRPTGPLAPELAAIATLATMGPALFFGRMEGETTSLLFGVGVSVALLALGRRIVRGKAPGKGQEQAA